MLQSKVGDICTVTSGIIGHQVNCMGVMGSGVAAAIRAKYPAVFNAYSFLCNTTLSPLLGTCQLVPVSEGLQVANLFGQQGYRRSHQDLTRYTSYDALDRALTELAALTGDTPVRPTIHLPMIGAGLGRGHWPIIEEIIKYRLSGFDVQIWTL